MVFENRAFDSFDSFVEYRTAQLEAHPIEERQKRHAEWATLSTFERIISRNGDRPHDYAVYIHHGGVQNPELTSRMLRGIETPEDYIRK